MDSPAPPTKKPVFNIDANPADANWIRIVGRTRELEATDDPAEQARLRAEIARLKGEPVEEPTPNPSPAPAVDTPPPPPVIEDVADVPLAEPDDTEPDTDNDDAPKFASRGWSTKKVN